MKSNFIWKGRLADMDPAMRARHDAEFKQLGKQGAAALTAATSDERRALVVQFLADARTHLKRHDPYIPGRKPRH